MISKNKVLLFICIVLLVMILLPFSVSADDPEDSQDALPPLEITIGGTTYTPDVGIVGYIQLIYKFAAGIVAGLAAIMIVIGGVQYATAAGNPKAIGSAKETIVSAIVGLVVVVTSYLILGLFGTQFTNLKEPDLPTVTVGENDNDNRVSYYCDSTGHCAMDILGNSSSRDCTGPGDLNKPCEYNPPGPGLPTDCSARSLSECEEDSECKICTTPNGSEFCVFKSENCGTSCTGNCLPDMAYETCLTTEELCNEACDPLPGEFSNGQCSGCGRAMVTAEECSSYDVCGSTNYSWKHVNGGKGWCRCSNGGTRKYNENMTSCRFNKDGYKQACEDYGCGLPQENNGKYCCTEK